MNFLKNMVTERDNITHCPVRILAVAGVVEYLALAAHIAIKTQTFDLQGFGTGLGIVLVAAGGAIAGKAMTESKPAGDA